MKSLTGRRRFRVEDDKLVLQVEEQEEKHGMGYVGWATTSWRDATIGDVTTHWVNKAEATLDIVP